jgi:hypothetical protein
MMRAACTSRSDWGATRECFLSDAVRVPFADHMLLPIPDE